jgi:hypothetical protein
MHFVTGHPAVLVEDAIVIADLHIGVERELLQNGVKVPSQTEKMKMRLDKIIQLTKAGRLIIAGDVKHIVPGKSFQEMKEIPEFLEHFQQKCEIEIVAGNHDGGLGAMLPSAVKFHGSEGIKLGDCFVCHGHAWPGKGFSEAKALLAGHSHPLYEFRDKLDYRFLEQVWLRTRMNKSKLEKRYGRLEHAPELVVIPAFNPLVGGYSINPGQAGRRNEYMGPVAKCADMKNAKVYMMDGMLLGELGRLGKCIKKGTCAGKQKITLRAPRPLRLSWA